METSRRGFMGFLGGVMGAIGLNGQPSLPPPPPEQRVVKINLNEIPVWVDEETLMRESGGAYGESILKEKK